MAPCPHPDPRFCALTGIGHRRAPSDLTSKKALLGTIERRAQHRTHAISTNHKIRAKRAAVGKVEVECGTLTGDLRHLLTQAQIDACVLGAFSEERDEVGAALVLAGVKIAAAMIMAAAL